MDKLKTISWILLIISLVSIVYALIFNPANWIVYAISLVAIPVSYFPLDSLQWPRVVRKMKKIKEENHSLDTKL
jgi:energy-converting hydrogenase A subunit I